MEITDLQQPPFNTTLLGCVKGAADHFGNEPSQAMLFGLTGHAFLINIHKELCPSGPYCWNTDGFGKLLGNAGIEWGRGWHFDKDVSIEQRQSVEQEIKGAIDSGSLAMLNFLENQLIGGYDEEGFDLLMPWDCQADTERRRVTFSTWEECLDTVGFAGFRILSKNSKTVDKVSLVKDALSYALELYRQPEKFQCESGHYRIGYGAYESWIDSVKAGRGDSHGNWWNGMVWAECRQMGGEFFNELVDVLPTDEGQRMATDLSNLYNRMGDNLLQIKEKELESGRKIALLEETIGLERQVEQKIDEWLKCF